MEDIGHYFGLIELKINYDPLSIDLTPSVNFFTKPCQLKTFFNYRFAQRMFGNLGVKQSNAAKVIQLPPPPAGKAIGCDPISYISKQDNKEYIILAYAGEEKLPIQRFDVTENKWEALSEYPEGFNPQFSIATIDEQNELLYISHGSYPLLGIFNLKTKKWEIIHTKGDKTYNEYKDPKNYKGEGRGVILPNQEFHLLITRSCVNYHIAYDADDKTFKSVSKAAINDHGHLLAINMVYIKGKQILLQTGGYLRDYRDEIWFTEWNKSNTINADHVWKKFPVKLPMKSTVCTAVAFGMILLVTYMREYKDKDSQFAEAIYVLDLGDDRCKWIKYNIGIKAFTSRMVITRKTHEIHFISSRKDNKWHFKIHLSEVLPTEMYNKYAKVELLIIGYIKDLQDDHGKEYKDIANLVHKYYSFVDH